MVYNAEIGNGFEDSFENLWLQMESLKEDIYSKKYLKKGFHIIAHSQGGLVARAFIQRYNDNLKNFRVHKFITLGSPHRGVSGIPDAENKKLLWTLLDRRVWSLAYSKFMQNKLSAAELWNDPRHHLEYLNRNIFIPILNNEISHPLSEIFKRNLDNLEKWILFKSTNEKVVVPAESCWMNYYSYTNPSVIEDYKDSYQYLYDILGFKSLYKNNKINYELVHCLHTEYAEDSLVFKKIQEHLQLYPDNSIKENIAIFARNNTYKKLFERNLEKRDLLEKIIGQEEYKRKEKLHLLMLKNTRISELEKLCKEFALQYQIYMKKMKHLNTTKEFILKQKKLHLLFYLELSKDLRTAENIAFKIEMKLLKLRNELDLLRRLNSDQLIYNKIFNPQNKIFLNNLLEELK